MPRSMNKDTDEFGTPLDEDTDSRLQTSNELDLNVEQDSRSPKVIPATLPTLSSKEDANPNGILKIGTQFESDEHAYRFYNKYARVLGFSVRKDWANRSKVHGQVVSRKFTCSREGYRRKDRRDMNVKKHRKETRTGCLAHMIITRQPDGKYRVTHFEANHNHDNIDPNNDQIVQLQKELSSAQAAEADLPDNLDLQSRADFELMSGRFEWAVVYGRNTYFLDTKGSHVVESLSNKLKSCLSSDQDMLHAFKHLERVVDEQRYKEFIATDEMGRSTPRIMANVIMLKHASEVYTTKAFELFQREYEKCLNLEEVIEGVEKILTSKPEEVQGITSSSTGANASESENAKVCLDENTVEDQNEVGRAKWTKENKSCVPHRRKLKNIHGRSSKSRRVQNIQAQSPNTVNCISSPPPAFVSPQAPTMESLYNLEANQVVQCMYGQPDLLVDQQPNTDLYQQPNFFSDQHDSPGQTQLLEETLIRSTYHDSVPISTHLRQAMELDLQSSSFLLCDHSCRYRASDPSYLEPK
ncbi:hypothetical protein CUMW_134550 [Citrus unshiu]|nr:hypothetical protein CUMW_134550 [Citrus unshiu]